MKKIILRILLVLVLIIAVAGIWFYFNYLKPGPESVMTSSNNIDERTQAYIDQHTEQYAEALAGEHRLGKEIFNHWCNECHGPGIERAGTIALLKKYNGELPKVLEERTDLHPTTVKAFVRAGVNSMPAFRKTEIDDKQLDALAKYLGRNFGKEREEETSNKKENALEAAIGISVYTKYCRACHGDDGKLQLGGAFDLSTSALTLDERIKVITEGRNNMAPYKDLLSREKIEAVAKHIETLQQRSWEIEQ